MKMNKLSYAVLAFSTTVMTAHTATASVIDLATSPLSVTDSNVDPNIMLMYDSSNSMIAVVPQAPYDASTFEYTCDNDKQMATDKTIELVVRLRDGKQFFRQKGESDLYEFGNRRNRDSQRCFANDKNYKARLFSDQPETIDREDYFTPHKLQPNYTGRYLNWYFYNDGNKFGENANKRPDTKTRIQIVREAGITLIENLENAYVGFASFQSSGNQAWGDGSIHSSKGEHGGKIHSGLVDIDTQQGKQRILRELNTQTEENLTYGTPLGEAFAHIGRYYLSGPQQGRNVSYVQGTDNSAKTIALDDLFNSEAVFYDNDDKPTTNSNWPIQQECQSNFIIGLTDGAPVSDSSLSNELKKFYNAGGSNKILDDVTAAMYSLDLRPDLDGKNNVKSYIIGFGDGVVGSQDLMESAVSAGGGEYHTANNAVELADALQETINSVTRGASSASKVAVSSQSISQANTIYRATFDTQTWTGTLKSYAIEDGNIVSDTETWDAANELDSVSPSDRTIYTTLAGVESKFDWSMVSTSTDLTQEVQLNYLRGDRTNEAVGSNPQLRERASVLGDIVNSAPVYVGAPSEIWEHLYDGYSDFKTARAGRPPMVYVGANDGMLHGFDATTGEEKMAYVPSQVYSSRTHEGLHYLSDPDYEHRFYVDLTPTVSDVYYDSAQQWKTLLIGGLRAGGKGYFALDVTSSSFRNTHRAARNKTLWELSTTNTGSSSIDTDLGYSYSQPVITKLSSGKWVAIFGNGYNSISGNAVLYIVDLEGAADGTWDSGDLTKVTTDTSIGNSVSPNGLSSPTVVDIDSDGIADRAYAGDLYGNMWAFDLSSSSITSSKLFSGDTSRPITSAPSVTGFNNASQSSSGANQLVIFGTGRYLSNTDTRSTDEQRFYAVWDNGSTNIDSSDLAERTLTVTLPTQDGDVATRVPEGDQIDWSTHQGWYFDLLPADSTAQDAAERIIHRPNVYLNAVYFNTTIPTTQECSSGGSSWIMAVDYMTGLKAEGPVLDTNNDGVLDDKDLLSSGKLVDDLVSESVIVGNNMFTNTSGNSGENVLVDELPTAGRVGRLGWQELIRD